MFRSYHRQSGSVLIVAVFVIVVMGMMAAMLNRMQWSNQDSHVREVGGVRAWLAAQSAIELKLSEVYPLNSDSAAVDNCTESSWTSSPIESQYEQCSFVQYKCEVLGEEDSDLGLYLNLNSFARCGTGVHEVERRYQVMGRVY